MSADPDEPAVKSASNKGTTAGSSEVGVDDNTEDEPAPARTDTKPRKPSFYKPAHFLARWLSSRTTARPDHRGQEPDAWDRAADWLLANGALPALAVITIAVFGIHAHIFVGETAGDDLSFHFAESARLMDCLRHGDFDLWNPSANGGYASAYYYQVIPQLASALPAAIFGHHLFWFQLSVILPIVLAPACAYKGMRLLGATPWQAAIAAFCVAFMNGASRWGAGNAGTFQVGLYTQTWALCAFPIALGYAYLWMTKGKHLAATVAWSAFVTLCHPFAGITLGFAAVAAWFATLVLIPFDLLFAALAPKLRGRLAWLGKRWAVRPLRERAIGGELVRGAIFAAGLVLAVMAIWLPLWIDSEGFGGFPHRVADEVGPGFKVLGKWYANGELLDWTPQTLRPRLAILTYTLPIILLVARGPLFRWLWAPAFLYALLLGVGPSIGKIGDDLIPPVRFLGGMQTVLAMGIGAGVIMIGQRLWQLADRWPGWAYGLRTVIFAAGAVLVVLIVVPGGKALGARVRTLPDSPNSRPQELHVINAILAKQPPGRKQSGPGAENHWWNLLAYAYERVPSTLQMGGGGLQASPNYDFLWTQRDYLKNAWVFDAPYVVFMSSMGSKVPLGQTIGKTANYEIRKLPSPGLVSPVTVTGVLPPGYSHKQLGHKKALEWIKSEQPMKDEVIAYAGSDKGNTAPPAGKVVRSWRQDSPGRDPDIVAELDVQSTTTFVVRESWHPRWHAYLDGKETAVRRVTPDFIAVDVPAGKHTLAVRFERPWWVHASWLAWPLTALAAWWLTRWWLTRRRQREPATIA